MKYLVIIPARYKSSRFPGKPLINLNGKSMLQRTYEQCIKAVPSEFVYVATEDDRIVSHCQQLSINVLKTSDNCLTGTDRLAEVAETLSADIYINVQGDEPLFNPLDILKVIAIAQKFPEKVVNGYCRIETEEQYKSLSVPKVVFDAKGDLLYMSRNPIPGNKRGEFVTAWRQVCIYAFPRLSLLEFAKFGKKTVLEEQEDIEILRFVELGLSVKMIELSENSIPIDNPEDVEKVLKVLNNE